MNQLMYNLSYNATHEKKGIHRLILVTRLIFKSTILGTLINGF